MRRFKGSKKEFRVLDVALIKNLVSFHKVLETVMIIDILFI